MGLLADSVARGRPELGGIDDGAGARIGQMSFGRAMAPFAGDCLLGKYWRSILIQSAGGVQFGPGMAQDASLSNGTREIRVRLVFVAGRKIVCLARAVVGHR